MATDPHLPRSVNFKGLEAETERRSGAVSPDLGLGSHWGRHALCNVQEAGFTLGMSTVVC